MFFSFKRTRALLNSDYNGVYKGIQIILREASVIDEFAILGGRLLPF